MTRTVHFCHLGQSRLRWVLSLILGGQLLLACAHAQLDDGGGGGLGRNSAEARITHLISEGQFAEAEALISEAASSSLIEQATATAFRRQVAELSMKLGEIPARLQRVPSFPAKLKDFTRHAIQKMYDTGDFSHATKKELQTALKLLKDVAKDNSRLLQKL